MKQGLISAIDETKDLKEVQEMLAHIIEESLEALEKANPDSIGKPIGKALARLEARKKEIMAAPEEADSALLKNGILMEKIKGLAEVAGDLDGLKNT